ncbi:peptide ABC transporter permease [Hyphomicrobium sp. NDB2Meth4]|nr:peptide ABC transporter permease [Hyphomicrobium sp. NDB2Meth4]
MSGENSRAPYPAEKARQGEIILRTRTQRIIFIGGLAGMLIVGLVATFMC